MRFWLMLVGYLAVIRAQWRPGDLMLTFNGHLDIVRTVIYDGRTLVTTSYDGLVIHWDPVTALPRRTIVSPVPSKPLTLITTLIDDVLVFYPTANENLFMYNLTSGAYVNWPFRGLRPFFVYQIFNGNVRSYNSSSNVYLPVFSSPSTVRSFLVDGSEIYISNRFDNIGLIRRWNRTVGMDIRNYTGHQDVVECIIKDGSFLYSSSWDGVVIKWNISSGAIVNQWQAFGTGGVFDLKITGVSLFGASLDGSIYQWNKDSGCLIRQYQTESRAYSLILWGSSMFAVYADAKMRQWFIGNASVANVSDTACYIAPPASIQSPLSLSNNGVGQVTSTTTSLANSQSGPSDVSPAILILIVSLSSVAAVGIIFMLLVTFSRKKRTLITTTSTFKITETSITQPISTATIIATASNSATQMQDEHTTPATSHELSIPAFMELQANIDYRIGSVIGGGGQSTIHECFPLSTQCYQRTQGETVIIKVISSDKLESMKEISQRSFMQEISIMYRFRDHPLFCKMMGYSAGNPVAILMKMYPLGDLRGYINASGAVSEQYIYSKLIMVALARRLFSAVAYMHLVGFAHADLKPANILLDFSIAEGLVPVLSDFGISAVSSSSVMKVGAFEPVRIPGASLIYAAPELLESLRSRAIFSSPGLLMCDAYALALTLYCMMTRVQPWSFFDG